MRGHVAKKGNRYYAVIYEGSDPKTGRSRYRWHAGGCRTVDAPNRPRRSTRSQAQNAAPSSPELLTAHPDLRAEAERAAERLLARAAVDSAADEPPGRFGRFRSWISRTLRAHPRKRLRR